jgi:lipopolysaccharide transport system permease protein
MALRDMKVRYRETLLGWTWALAQPIITVAFLAFVFQSIAQVPTGGVAPFLFGMSGYIIWGSFANNIAHSTHLLRNSRSMIRKIYFPRILLPTSGFLVNMIETVVALLLLFAAAIYYDQTSIAHPISFIVTLLAAGLVSWGISTILAGVNLRYRDVNFIIPILLRMGLIITPIAFSVQSAPESYQLLMYANPATAFIELLRWSLWDLELNAFAPYFAIGWALLFPVFGILYLNWLDRFIADVL